MVIANIIVNDSDSLEAAADLYDFEVAAMARLEADFDYLDVDPDRPSYSIVGQGYAPAPEPPTPAAPAACPCCEGSGLAVHPAFAGKACWFCDGTGADPGPAGEPAGSRPCGGCQGMGTRRYHTGAGGLNAWVEVACPLCDGSGRERIPPAPGRRFDRAAHCQAIGKLGGLATVHRYGVGHMRALGKAGYRATASRYGVGHTLYLLKHKGWTGPRRPDLMFDLQVGRERAAISRAENAPAGVAA